MAHSPLRMCAVCRNRFAKAQLLRHVLANNEPVADTRQRMPGRGIYVCTHTPCRERFVGVLKKYTERTLKHAT